ncbi:MAG: hypothetical protein SF069_00345 [Phycisphaerae bacterium]|jgi:hypothetical protein|nr:hypothetical protein [Phycisphaerae bacterium]
MAFPLDDDTLHGLAGGEMSPDPAPMRIRGANVVNKAIISIVFGCLFLLAALSAVIIALRCLWGGVFENTEPLRAVAGFFGSVLIAIIGCLAGWRFISRA